MGQVRVNQSEEIQTDPVIVSSASRESKATCMGTPIMLSRKSQTPEMKQKIEWLLPIVLSEDDEIEVVEEFIPEPHSERAWRPYPKPVPGQIHQDAETVSQKHRGSLVSS